MQTRLKAVVGNDHTGLSTRPIEDSGEIGEIVGFAPREIADARMRSDEQRAPFAEGMFHHSQTPVLEGAEGLAALKLIGLQKAPATDWAAAEIKFNAVADVGHELDFIFPHTENFIQTMVGLDCPDLSAIAEIARRGFRYQRAALLYPTLDRLGRRAGHGDGVRGIEEIVLTDVVNMHPVGLYAIVEKAPIGAPHGLPIGFRTVLGIEQIIPGLRFGDDQNADIAPDRTRLE